MRQKNRHHAARETVAPGSRIRQANLSAALQSLFNLGPLSRAELARQLGLNRSSSGEIVSELVASGLVREVNDVEQERSSPARAGRPGILLELDSHAACFVGAEIGVEHITTLRMDLSATILQHQVEPFDSHSIPAEEAVEKAVSQAMQDLPAECLDHLAGFSLSVPAQLTAQGHVMIAPLLGWQSTDLASLVHESLEQDLPVIIENDANAFAFGESYRNMETQAGVTLFLVIETGMGGGIVIDGKLFRGGHGLAGEIGHVPMREGEELEQQLGLANLLQRHADAIRRKTTSLDDFLRDVQDRVPGAVTIAEDWARDLAYAIVASCRLIDPNRVVLGGSVSALYPMVETQVAQHIKSIQSSTFPVPEIIVHEAAEIGAAYGAACMLHRQFLLLDNDSARGSDVTSRSSGGYLSCVPAVTSSKRLHGEPSVQSVKPVSSKAGELE